MKGKLLKTITVIMVIITMTMANFILLGANMISYAAESISSKEETSHKNVSFTASLMKDSEESTELRAKMNATDLKLHLKVSVKQEGYFNGKITINNSNFKLKTDILSEGINQIEGNTISLAQINAGETRDIVVGIEVNKDDNFNLSMLDAESNLLLEGIYRDSTEKDISVTGERTVKLQLVSPYDEENKGIFLENTIITNSVVQYDGQNRRVVQLYVKSGIDGNLFPIKTSTIEIEAPKLNDKYPEEVIVTGKGALATNGKQLTDDNWGYDKESGKVTIELSNDANNNIVNWKKTGADEFYVTFVFEDDSEIENQPINSSSQINLYDVNQTRISYRREITLTSEELTSFVTLEISNQEDSMYKGKLYNGIDKEFTQNIVLNLNFTNVANSVEIKEDLSGIGFENVYNKQIVFSKDNLSEILGDNGFVKIYNDETGELLISINKESQADSNGNIVFVYPENVKFARININADENKSGQLRFSNTKVIKANAIDTVRNIGTINYKLNGTYGLNGLDQTKTFESNVQTIELKETETSAELEVNKTELSTMSVNDVEIRAVLKSKSEQNELYKNPVLDITLPSQVQNININSINLLYEDELRIANFGVLEDGRTIRVILEGEQTKYKEEAIDGATVIINASLTLDKKAGSSTEQIGLVYTNEKAIHYPENKAQGETSKEINVVSYAGLVTTTTIPNKGIEIINNEGTKTAKLDIGAEQTELTINSQIMNNNSGIISDVRVLGVFPVNGATSENNIDIQITQPTITGIDASKVKIYYTENQEATESLENVTNGWTEEFTGTAKKYLIVITDMNVQEIANISYNAVIPANLEYNAVAKMGYNISYMDNTTSVSKNVNLDLITLETGVGPVVEAELKVTNAGSEVESAREGEILTYKMIAKNTGSVTVNNVSIKGMVPEGTVYVEEIETKHEMTDEEVETGYKEYPEKTEVVYDIEQLNPGETREVEYQVRVQKGGKTNSTISNIIDLEYGEVKKQSNELVTNIEPGELEISLIDVDQTGAIQAGYVYRYAVRIRNIADTNLQNISLNVNLENARIQEMMYANSNEEVITSSTNMIEIDNLEENEELDVGIYVEATPFNDTEVKSMKLSAVATVNNISYGTNEKNININSNMLSIENYSQNSGDYVKAGDEITYRITVKNEGNSAVNDVIVSDKIPAEVSIVSVQKDGQTLAQDSYEVENDITDNGKFIRISDNIEAQTTREYTITVAVNKGIGNQEAMEIVNTAELYVDSVSLGQSSVNHILEPDSDNGNGNTDNPDNPDNPNNPGDPSNPSDPSNPGTGDTESRRIISGIAWFDQNENGQRDENEQLIAGVTVRLLNTQTNEFAKDSNGKEITATTNNNGFYSLSNVAQGSYMVIFEYDTSKYTLTTYQKEGIDTQYTSKAVDKKITINGEEKTVGGTEVIEVSANNISNINIGLKQAKVFDLRLDKYVSKVIVQNSSGTSTYEYDDATIAKAEIDSKLINSTSIVVEYKIRITNEGEVDAYVRNIVDYMSSDYRFSSELNKDWYQSDGKLYNNSLANEKLSAGQSKEITLTLTKQMTENNTGLVPNTAEIAEVYNEQGLSDVDSTPGNNVNTEDDLGSAELIISIKTGQVVATVAIILVSIIVIGTGAFFVTKMILRRRII